MAATPAAEAARPAACVWNSTGGSVARRRAWLHGRQLRDEARAASQHALRVAELRGSIAYLDEWMTASARLAAATGEHQWVGPLQRSAPKLDAAIAEAARAGLAGGAWGTDQHHRRGPPRPRHHGTRALALAEGGDLALARALLNGPEFAYLKDVTRRASMGSDRISPLSTQPGLTRSPTARGSKHGVGARGRGAGRNRPVGSVAHAAQKSSGHVSLQWLVLTSSPVCRTGNGSTSYPTSSWLNRGPRAEPFC